jgi:hypothetical protein
VPSSELSELTFQASRLALIADPLETYHICTLIFIQHLVQRLHLLPIYF